MNNKSHLYPPLHLQPSWWYSPAGLVTNAFFKTDKRKMSSQLFVVILPIYLPHITWTKIVSGLTPKWYMISILCPFLHVVCAVLCLIGKTVKTVEVLGEVVDECVWCNSINWNVIMYLCAVRVIDYKCSQYQLLANACWVVVVYVCAMILLKERLGCLIWYFFLRRRQRRRGKIIFIAAAEKCISI